MIVDYGGDMNNIIHEGNKAEEFYLKDGNIPEPSPTNVEINIFQTIIKRQLESGETDRWNKTVNTCMGFYEEIFKGVHHMCNMEKTCTNHQNRESKRT